MRATPGLVGSAGIAAGLMLILGRQRGKRRRPALPAAVSLAAALPAAARLTAALPAAASLTAGAVAGARQAISRVDAPRRVTDFAEAARRLRPEWRHGRITLRRRRRLAFLHEHPWAVFGMAASLLAAGTWRLWRREPGKVRMATTIEAPIERVFDAWSRVEDFPRFMPMVAEVRPSGDDRWQWTIANPGRPSIQLVSWVTQRDRPHLIAWAADGGAGAQHTGTVRFHPTADSKTRMKIEIVRRVSSGAVGQDTAVATGLDPERSLREGLAAFKARVEAAHHGA
jgi:uncharacterized membrane protein